MDFQLLKGSRSRILAGIVLVMAALFVIRLFQLQVIQGSYYKGLADAEQIKQRVLPAQRGLVYALDGGTPVQMVLNQTVYTVFADPATVTDTDKVISTMHSIAGGNTKSNIADLLSLKESRYQVIATKVTRAQADKIKAVDLSGIGFTAVNQRVYPEGALAAQVLGFVDADGQGQYGVEGGMNDELKGKDGLLKSVTDVADVPLTIGDENVETPAQNGKNVVLSIDRNVQSKAEQALADGMKKAGATHGSVIVMNPQNGQVMAMANLPSYDPANYGQVTDAADFNNNVISNPYEPGSDIKTFTMATGVDKGVVKATDTYNNTGVINVDGISIHNANGDTQYGNITFQTALQWSLNTGFVTVAERLGDGQNITQQARNTMYDYFHNKFRLGQLTGVELAGEQQGTIIPPTETEGNAVRYSNMSFGQGMDVTMLQVASGFSSIINGGKYYKPTVVAGTMGDDGSYQPNAAAQPIEQTISKDTSDQIRAMTQKARHDSFPHVDTPGYFIGGKTGTSQVAVNGGYSSTDTIGTYLGYGGGSTSNYVIMVEVSAPGKALGGAQNALPIFTDISNWLLQYLKVQPNQ
jgi:cell division protein FtsI/penicillin-binding protein 2